MKYQDYLQLIKHSVLVEECSELLEKELKEIERNKQLYPNYKLIYYPNEKYII